MNYGFLFGFRVLIYFNVIGTKFVYFINNYLQSLVTKLLLSANSKSADMKEYRHKLTGIFF